jgi:hypothetical protein
LLYTFLTPTCLINDQCGKPIPHTPSHVRCMMSNVGRIITPAYYPCAGNSRQALNGLWSAALVLFSSIDPGFKIYYISMGSDVELEILLLIASKMGFINVEDETHMYCIHKHNRNKINHMWVPSYQLKTNFIMMK